MKIIPKLSEKDIKRFWSNVDIKSENECWIWTAGKDSHGYGRISISFDKKKSHVLAHRISYFLHYEVDPGELCVLHKCDVPNCVRFDHLFLGTLDDNNKDRKNKGRSASLKGSENGNAKLTEEQIIAIRNDNRTQKDIGKDYNICQQLVSLIKARKLWKYVV